MPFVPGVLVFLPYVMPGLDPGIQRPICLLDSRVKPENDKRGVCFSSKPEKIITTSLKRLLRELPGGMNLPAFRKRGPRPKGDLLSGMPRATGGGVVMVRNYSPDHIFPDNHSRSSANHNYWCPGLSSYQSRSFPCNNCF